IFGLLESFIDFKIEWVACLSNKVVDSLCKLAINKRCTFPFNMEYPSDIHGLIKPPNDAIKINVDAKIFDSIVGIGIIVRGDNDGFVLEGRTVFLDHKIDIEWAEVEALRERIMWARN
ncbi:hypothetical protein Gohar_020039, partial [Gossypium harknessii]|nr:hypothetical protein [Gossypium harknessii]